MNEQPLIFAHRGARDVAPENTLAAFQAALEADADGVELDVTCCATGEIVIMHDDTVDRTTDGASRVADLSFSALRALDAGAWFGPAFAGQRVPTLEEALTLCAGRLRVNIEIKRHARRAPGGEGIEARIAEMVRARGLQEQVIISSFDPLILARMRRAAPELPLGLLYDDKSPPPVVRHASLALLKLDALHPRYNIVDEAFMRRARRRGWRVNVWTVNEPDAMRAMIALGVDAIITDHPARLRALLPR